jgi:hypothetical protein
MTMVRSGNRFREDDPSCAQADAALGADGLYGRLWRLALPFLATRRNEIHTRLSVGLAFRLLALEGGEEPVVIPAVILHDVGWKCIPEPEQLKAFGPCATRPELNRAHEVEGVKIAAQLLAQAGLDARLNDEILMIIDGHDSRRDGVSHNDCLVKDADKLWRYTREGLAIDTERFGETYAEGIERLRGNRRRWFLTASGRKLAEDLLRVREKEAPGGGWNRGR